MDHNAYIFYLLEKHIHYTSIRSAFLEHDCLCKESVLEPLCIISAVLFVCLFFSTNISVDIAIYMISRINCLYIAFYIASHWHCHFCWSLWCLYISHEIITDDNMFILDTFPCMHGSFVVMSSHLVWTPQLLLSVNRPCSPIIFCLFIFSFLPPSK